MNIAVPGRRLRGRPRYKKIDKIREDIRKKYLTDDDMHDRVR